MDLSIYNIKGEDTGRKVALADEMFAVEPNDHAIYQDVRLILSNKRQGTNKSKERGEVSGSKKKPYRQKGTGNARPGHKRSPLWRHGGTIFGPRPRKYSFKLNKKQRRLARQSALTYKLREEKVTVLENFSFDAPKTKQYLSVLNNFNLADTKTLLLVTEEDKNVHLSGRNLPQASIMLANEINTYDLLNADTLLLTEGALKVVNELYNN